MHRTQRSISFVGFLLASAAIGGLGAGCGYMDLEAARGNDSLLAVFQGPSPTRAAEWALDPYNPDNRYRGTLILANEPFGGEGPYIDLFVDASDDVSANVRSAGVRGLANHGRPEHVAILIERLDDETELVRLEAARGLQRLHNPIAIEPLIALLEQETDEVTRVQLLVEPNAEIRAAAADALGQYADRRVISSLATALNDADLIVNRNALSSLRTLTGQDFGMDPRGWLEWERTVTNPFEGRTAYTFPAFSRDRRLLEYIPIFPPPPNEASTTPIGMPPIGRERPPALAPEEEDSEG
ncbi:MAG: HEAT repeat domain-containing protein [Planctomycetota bacterium]